MTRFTEVFFVCSLGARVLYVLLGVGARRVQYSRHRVDI